MRLVSAYTPLLPVAVVVCSILATLAPAAFAASDSFEAYRLQQRQGAQKILSEFHEYKESQDREFSDFLKAQWREFDTFQGKVRIKEPKPRHPPVVIPPVQKPPPEIPAPEKTPGSRGEPSPERPVHAPAVAPAVVEPRIEPPPPPPQPKPLLVSGDTLQLSFYGNTISFQYDPGWKEYRLPRGGDKPAAMSAFWTMMSGSKYEPAIESVDSARRELKLDDWGHVTLWRDAVQAIQPGRIAEQNLLLWYFLIKSGYDVRLGYAGSDIHLFVAIKQQVFSTKFTRVGAQTYYAALAPDRGDSIGSFYTYEASYPVRLKPLELANASTGFTKPVSAQRSLTFTYRGKTINLNAPYDRRLVQYLGSFPQSEFEVYYDTDSSQLLRQALLGELKKHIATMSEEDAVNFLLAFVQNAFAYKTDKEQFGYEKYFFVEESFFFPYSDCEDRSVLFAWLVHELVGNKMIGLVYPGHMTTGVALKQAKPGYSTVMHNGTRFVIADPTYIGASVGMAMPSYAKLKPKRIVEIPQPGS